MRLNSCLIAMALLAGSAQAQYFRMEYFSEYANNANVENAASASDPDAGKWTYKENTSGSKSPVVVASPLSYSNYIASGKGKAMEFTPSSGAQRNTVFCLSREPMPYPCQPYGTFVEGSNVFYTAFLLDLSATTTADIQEIFSWYQLSSAAGRGVLSYKLSSDKTKVAFTFAKKDDVSSPEWSANYTKSSVFLIVVKYTHICLNERNLGHGSFEVFINPNPLKSESENSTSSIKMVSYGDNTGYDMDLRYLSFRQSGATDMKISGLRIANTFEKVLRGPDTPAGIDGIDKAAGALLFSVSEDVITPLEALNGRLSIWDADVRKMRSYELDGQQAIQTNLQAGVYLLVFENDSGEQRVQKIIIR
ncbi:hypothetical protein FACS189413_03000 [Bacteroidia bacterium]|nr:hypothetical protein FACS189413_03000 [Bacteroidia bacterium]